jgi:hypothetical protein
VDDATGEVLWSTIYGPSIWHETAYSMALDSQGNILVAGRVFSEETLDDLLLLRFDGNDGSLDWAFEYDGSDSLDDRAWSLVLDSSDNAYVTGSSAWENGDVSFLTMKINSQGQEVWRRLEPGAVNNQTRAGWVDLDPLGMPVIANRTWTSESSYDVFLRKYSSSDGSTLWESGYNGPTSSSDDLRDMTLDSEGNILVTGVSNSDFMVLKFAGNGDLLWDTRYDGPPGWYDLGNRVTWTPMGEVVATGFSDGGDSSWDAFTLGVDESDGSIAWELRLDGSDGLTDEGQVLFYDENTADLFVGGYSYSYQTDMDQLLIRYSLAETAVPGMDAFTRLRAWPNPSAGEFHFSLSLEQDRSLDLAVYDLRGRRVRHWDGMNLQHGDQQFTWDGKDSRGRDLPSGVYFLRASGFPELRSPALVILR